jgi:Raf kinase inhibitor-like YbhB/YbcL family protein
MRLVTMVCLWVCSAACAVPTTARQVSPRLAIADAEAGSLVAVQSPAFAANAPIPAKYTDYGEKISPPLAWSGVPPAARALVLLAEDPDAGEPRPYVHWLLYNLPATMTSLPESIPPTPRLPEFGGALQGRNSRGTFGYFGPRPPRRDRPHRYHFQLFAIDMMLPLDPGATPEQVLSAMKGRVVAAGEVIGTFEAPKDRP